MYPGDSRIIQASCHICNRDLQIKIQDLVRVGLFKPSVFALDCHISLQSRTDSLLFNWSATGTSECSGNITGLKFESCSYSISYFVI